MNENTKTFVSGAAAIAVVILILLFSGAPRAQAPSLEKTADTLGERIRTGEAGRPEFTDAVREKIEKSTGFQHLVSYTDRGFEPPQLTIKEGETIRFTNNSSGELWVSANGESGFIYPYTQREAGCGTSDFDSCGPYPPQDFWEFMFIKKGTWSFANAGDSAMRAVVIVE